MKDAKLYIKETERPFSQTDKSWYFLKHEVSNYDLRWVIGWRKKDNWWGVIAAFPATHESGIDEIVYEMALAKIAIKKLKQQLVS